MLTTIVVVVTVVSWAGFLVGFTGLLTVLLLAVLGVLPKRSCSCCR